MHSSYWLFGEQAVNYLDDYSEEKTPNQLAKEIAINMDHCIYEFDPSLEYSADELLSIAMGWDRYIKIDNKFYELLLAFKEVSHV